MQANREKYLKRLVEKKHNGRIKIITGLRRVGKSYLLFELFAKHLHEQGVDDDHILKMPLDEHAFARYRNPMELDAYIRARVRSDDKMHYVFLDEIQFVATIQNPWLPGDTIGFVDVLLGLMKIRNADIYVTGSNSRMLSKDVVTQFRDRGDEIRVNPLTFREYCDACDNRENAWLEYRTYGGLPNLLNMKTHEEKASYLKNLFASTYTRDVLERNKLDGAMDTLDDLLKAVSSSVGSLTNPAKISNTFKSELNKDVAPATITKYLGCFEDAFILEKANRYDVKGRRYLGTPMKYYYTDIGLRNAKLDFRQQEESRIMENILYNELRYRGFEVDVGSVEYNFKEDGKSKRKQLEIDFVVNKGSERIYIQSALTVADAEKMKQETESLRRTKDYFKKVIITKDEAYPWHTEEGILVLNLRQFLLNENLVDEGLY